MLDTRTLLPSMATTYSDEGGRKRYKTSTFKGNGSVQYRSQDVNDRHFNDQGAGHGPGPAGGHLYPSIAAAQSRDDRVNPDSDCG